MFETPWSLSGTPIQFGNVSVPKENPIHYAPNEQALREAIFERINQANVVVIPTGMYANHSKWIQKEIDGANAFGKPILAVNPWGQEKKSAHVTLAARETVGWTSDSVINGIWRLRSG
ncbi:TIR domain-containing protein [Erythrobacter sp.]|uniref:TIR domain-containing protein n=1 Tax=Erythrobacter sp. TaxID=1042 RepID=UPI0034257B0E